MTGARTSPLSTELTDKQRVVLALIAEGFDNIGIASILGIKKNSVRVHVKEIYWKLGYINAEGDLSSRYDLIVRTRCEQEARK